MPDDWIPNCATQLERAIRALFVQEGAASVADCFISNESTEIGNLATGVTIIRASSSTTEDSEQSGNEKLSVSIQNKFDASVGPSETNTKLNRVQMDRRVGRQMLAMSRWSSDPGRFGETIENITDAGRELATLDAENESDMSEFTCLFVRYLGMTRGQPEDNSCAWVEARNYEITVCPSNVD